ncbi:hypothetical protein DE146DRAFT_631053 [Phaeosphaeria sp. MPI-PUGE-AT-0046c]|nr:hypothetical protein DE146DRAFT_631053 [Phaeosphaeria sp. MPI-PUGE-AT-0046c]
MAPTKAYVPSRALLRALSRPQPLRCPFSRSLATPWARGKRTKATPKPERHGKGTMSPGEIEKILEPAKAKWESQNWDEEAFRPLTDKELEADDIPPINWYEQDLDKGTPRRLVSRLATAEDRKKDRDMFVMIQESETNPDYDDARLNRRLVDSLLENPNFADLTQELKDIKAMIFTKEEKASIDEKARKDAEAFTQGISGDLRTITQQALQDLINDPAAAVAREDLQEVLDKMPLVEDIENAEFQGLLNTAMEKLNNDPVFQQKMATTENDGGDDSFEKEWNDFEGRMDEMIKEDEEPEEPLSVDQEPEELQLEMEKLLYQMRDVMQSMDIDPSLEKELDAVISEDPTRKQDGDFDREMDGDELANELFKLVKSKSLEAPKEPEEDVSAELQAKVDKIMEDPKLMEKLLYIQKLIEDAKRAKSDITSIEHEVAPDPYELEDSRTATLKQRMAAARRDPEHTAALDRLRVTLPSPFNISPALKSFNQAIELAYIGANDDIRRILWRSYQKARTLPTFLQSLNDEAWDILYYSQAVTWGSNQNRQDHLRTVLADLKSLGKDGPPTHPSSLVKSGDGQHLEA